MSGKKRLKVGWSINSTLGANLGENVVSEECYDPVQKVCL